MFLSTYNDMIDIEVNGMRDVVSKYRVTKVPA